MDTNAHERRELGKWVQQRRIFHQWTQAALAEKLGCTVNLISKIEQGLRNVSAKQAPRIMKVFGLSDEEQIEFLLLLQRTRATAVQNRTRRGRRGPSPHTNLPEPHRPLIGREQDTTSGADLLNAPHVRLLTLSGPPGIGKTRLAIAIAERVQHDYPDGVCFTPLETLASGSDISPALLDSLSFILPIEERAEQPKRSELPTLIAHLLSKRRLLLVLDNFEHVLSEANLQMLSRLLSVCPKLKIIATSRVSLNLRGEQLITIQPLEIPAPAQTRHLTELAQQPAVALFVSRAQSVNAAFKLTPANAVAIGDLCTFSEGVPLVLEMMAARVRLLSPMQLLAQITLTEQPQSLADFMLTLAGPRDAPEHQHTLTESFEWSYRLLQQDEQVLLMKLSVFAGGFSADAAAVVCDATLPLLESLVAHSLVQIQYWDASADSAEPSGWQEKEEGHDVSEERVASQSREITEYRILAHIRAFALKRLCDSEHYVRVFQRHADYSLRRGDAQQDRN